MRIRFSLTTRLTTLFAIVSSVALAVLGGVTLIALEWHFAAQDRDALSSKIRMTQNLVSRVDSPAAFAALPSQFQDAFAGQKELAVAAFGPDGETLYDNVEARFPRAFLKPTIPDRSEPITWQDGDRQMYGTVVAVPTRIPMLQPVRVVIAIEIKHHTDFMAKFRQALGGYVVLAALGCGLLGWLVVRHGLMPLYAMKERASSVTAGNLDLRMPIESVPIEMAELAATLNQMLDRLEDAFRRLSEFSANIAHELRTPISNLMTQTQVALSQARSDTEYHDVLASNSEEFERLARMVSDMLFLARAEQGMLLPSREEIALDQEVMALFEFYEALADAKGVALHLSGRGKIIGDRLMIRRAISNLLSNALRFTPAGQTIRIAIQTERYRVIVKVHNAGPEIDPEALPHIFDRFYRVKEHRSHLQQNVEGAGLGLAITKAIVTSHGGEISVQSNHDGTVFSIAVPCH